MYLKLFWSHSPKVNKCFTVGFTNLIATKMLF